MAQSDPRLRHHRQPSRLLRLNGNEANRKQQLHVKSVRDRETVNFIKHVLCSTQTPLNAPGESPVANIDDRPLEELLPPLTSSNAVDVQLYAIIAVILSQFVQSWYNRITPDQHFVAEIVQIIAHCTRGIEDRLRHVDLDDLLLDELPALLVSHIDAVKIAQNACFNNRSSDELRTIYHTLQPNKALTPVPDDDASVLEQQSNEIAWSQLLTSHVLPLLLPPEDLSNPCLHVLVSEIFSEMIVRNALCGKASEPWIIWEGTTKLINTLRPNIGERVPATVTPPPTSRLENFGLLSTQTNSARRDLQAARRGRLNAIAQVFWTTLQVAAMFWLFLRSLVIALMHGSSIPARHQRSARDRSPNKVRASAVAPASRPSPQHTTIEGEHRRPVVTMRIWTCLSRLSGIEQRMPWLSGFASLLRWKMVHGAGNICDTDSVLDRLMAATIAERLCRPDLLPSVLQAIRGALFPNNALAAARLPPTAAEMADLKRDCADTIVNTIPPVIASRFFATKDHDLMRQDVERTLDLFADPYLNKHFIISAVELVIVRVFPELAEDALDGL